MKPTFHRPSFLRAIASTRSRRKAERGFSLIEVTLALGLSAFALVGVLGVIPSALSTARQSFDQNRAAAIANTLFASFRSQPFDKVGFLDQQFGEDGLTTSSSDDSLLNLNVLTGSAGDKTFYASFLDPSFTGTSTADGFGAQRRLCFLPSGSTPSQAAANYVITMHFNNAPAGVLVANGSHAEANQVEMVISPISKPGTKYSFVSTIAHRF